MKKIMLVLLMFLMGGFAFSPLVPAFAGGESTWWWTTNRENFNFGLAIEETTQSLSGTLDAVPTEVSLEARLNSVFVEKVIQVLFPVLIMIGILVAMVGLYSLFTNPDKTKEGMTMILGGVVGILLLYSARYISTVIFSDMRKKGVAIGTAAINVSELIKTLYNQIFFPFLKLAIYLVLGILVIIMMTRVFTYITSQEEDVKKKSLGVITRTTVGMLIITGAKQIVEAIYGAQDKVLNASPGALSDIGSTFLDPKTIDIIFQILNWALGLISFILLAMIVYQTYKMLTKPDDEETFKSLKWTIIYALWGLILIGAAYLVANLLIIN